MFLSSITNEQINALPRAYFDGEILLVDDNKTMLRAEKKLNNQHLLGIDTETKPAFKKGVYNSVALIQVATQDSSILFRTNKIALSENIIGILEDANVLKIGAALHDDLIEIRKSIGMFKPKGFIDLQQIVHKWGICDKSVKKLTAITLKTKLSKAQRLSNWEANILTEAQRQYASLDAWVCREIYLKLKASPKVTPKILSEASSKILH